MKKTIFTAKQDGKAIWVTWVDGKIQIDVYDHDGMDHGRTITLDKNFSRVLADDLAKAVNLCDWCGGTGEVDSGGVGPDGSFVNRPCVCQLEPSI